jgi:hypothetical protein
MRSWTPLAGALVLAALAGGPAHAQGWSVDVAAGGSRHEAVTAVVETNSAIVGLRYQGVPWLYLSLGAPLDGTGQSWAAAGAGRRLSARAAPRLAVGADLAAHGYGYQDRVLEASGTGATLEALPFLAVSGLRTRLETYSGVRYHATRFDGVSADRSVHDSGARLHLAPAHRLALTAEGRYVRADGTAHPYLGAGAEVALGPGMLWALAGRWLDEVEPTPVWGVGAAAGLGNGLQLRLSLDQDGRDPLYRNAPRRRWSVGLSRPLGQPPVFPPTAPPVAVAEDGQVTIVLPLAEAAEPPALAGDFTGWEPVEMTLHRGHWTVTLPVGPGVHRYAFRRADGTWFVPEGMPGRTDDGFGGVSAVLVVPRAGTG